LGLSEGEVFVKAARGAGALGAQNIASVLLALVFFMVFARMVSKAEMGAYGAVYLILSVLIIVGNFGLGFAASHFLPFYHGRNETSKMLSASKRILLLSTILGVVLLAVSLILADFFSLLLLGTMKYGFLFRITAVAVFAGVLGFTFDGFLRGLQKFNRLALYRLLSQALRVGASIGLLLLGFGVAAVFIGWIFFYLALSILAAILTIKILLEIRRKNSDLNVVDNPFPFKAIFGFSLPMMVFQLVTYLFDSIDRYVVLGLLGTEPLGVYTVVMTAVSSIMMILVMPLLSTLIPSMSEVYGRAGAEKLSEVFRLSSRYISLIFIPACFGFAVLSPLAIRILAGSAYVEAALPLAIVSIGMGPYGFSAALLSSLTALGKTLRVALAVLFASLIEFMLCLLLVPWSGVVGAALGRALTYIAMFGLLVFFGSKFMVISVDCEAVLKSGFASAIMSLIVYCLAFLTNYKLIMLPLYLIVGVIIYLLFLTLFKTLAPTDVQFFKKIIPKGEKIFRWLEKLPRNFIFLV
jgi:O-antigen/teichoic acid export membrane protein